MGMLFFGAARERLRVEKVSKVRRVERVQSTRVEPAAEVRGRALDLWRKSIEKNAKIGDQS